MFQASVFPNIAAAGTTDVGRRRSNNEDAFCIDHRVHLYVVADGMGGHALGEVASREALAALQAYLDVHGTDAVPADRAERAFPPHVLQNAVRSANDAVFALNSAKGFAQGAGMGTAIAGAWFADQAWWVFHVGDCRVYRWREGQLKCLTRDHTLHEAWVDHGAIGTPPPKNILVRSVGPRMHVEADVRSCELMDGDELLLCSDGLTTMLTDEDLAACLKRDAGLALEERCKKLVTEANGRGGVDNVTVVLLRV